MRECRSPAAHEWSRPLGRKWPNLRFRPIAIEHIQKCGPTVRKADLLDAEEWFLGKDSVRKFRQLTFAKLLPVSSADTDIPFLDPSGSGSRESL